MSEVETPFDAEEERVVAVGMSAAPTAGLLLREARVAAGVHIESIAFSLKVPVGKIEALESDDVSAFSDTTFMRALASSVCRGLRIDSTPILALMPQGPKHRLIEHSDRPRATFRDPSGAAKSPAWVGRPSRWLAVSVLLLLVAAAAVAFTPQGWSLPDWGNMTFAPETAASSPVVSAVVGETATSGATVTRPNLLQTETPNTVEVSPASRSSQESALASPTGSVASPETSVPAKLAPKVEPPVPAAGMAGALDKHLAAPRLSMVARGETWVQVMDANRKVLLERVLKKGDAVSVNQPGQLSVVIGRADVTDVQVAGDPRDITKSARDNVARFEVAE